MEIQLYSKLNDPLSAITQLGNMFAKSGMFGCDRAEQGQVLAMICLAEMKSPTAIVRDYHIIEGKLSKKALAALADFRNAGGRHKWIKTGDEGKDDEREAVGEFEFQGNKLTVKFSMADAKKAMLIRPRSAWDKQPANMLRARVISNAVAMLSPEIYAGDESSDEPQQPAKEINLGVKTRDEALKEEGVPTGSKVQLPKVTTAHPRDVNAEAAESEAEYLEEKNKKAKVQLPKQGTNVTVTTLAGETIISGVATVVDTTTGTIDVESELAPLPFTISEELANQVVAAVGEHLADVVDWMVEQDDKAKAKGKPGWISREQIKMHPENPFRFLTPARAQQVISAAPQCIGVVKQWKEAKGKA